MRISKMGFVMQMLKKVFSLENGFCMVVTGKGLEVGSKNVLHFEGVSERRILSNSCDVLLGLGWGFGVSASHICSW